MTTNGSSRLQARSVSLAYERRTISEDLNLQIPDGSYTVIIGPNACGKSTLLRGLSRLLKPSGGDVVLDGRSLRDFRARSLAAEVTLLPQTAIAPEGITVAELVQRGRYPHQGAFRRWTVEDEEAVSKAMSATNVDPLAEMLVDELSGGQRQRVWVAMALAQQTPIMLLDEPTTFLDIAHQIELLDLFEELQQLGHTLVAVLHDINHAARYATHLVVMRDGAIVTEGVPEQIITAELIEEVFGLACVVVPDPETGTPLVVPRSRTSRAAATAVALT